MVNKLSQLITVVVVRICTICHLHMRTYCHCFLLQETEIRYLGKTQNAAPSDRKNSKRDQGVTYARNQDYGKKTEVDSA